MQQFTIGRGDNCRIRIQDNTQRISRCHATLKVMDNGNIFITDHSSNGTFVNGIKITPSTDFPIKRSDSISFANIAELNWELIPKRTNKTILYSIIGVSIIVVCVVAGYLWFNIEPTPIPPTNIETLTNEIDSTEIKKKLFERDKFVKDSTNQAKQDSLIQSKNKELEDAKQKLKEKKKKDKKATEPAKPSTDSSEKVKPKQFL